MAAIRVRAVHVNIISVLPKGLLYIVNIQVLTAMSCCAQQDLAAHVHFIAGVPIKPMLAKPTTGVTEVLDKFTDTDFTCEYKYDGERAQLHILEVNLTFRLLSC